MRPRLFAALLVASTFACPPVDAGDNPSRDTLLRDALAAEAKVDTATALALFRRADALSPNDPFVLRKISQQLSELVEDTTDAAERKRLGLEALSFAERAAALAPNNAAAVLSVAISESKLALLEDTRGKIERSRRMHDYAERALALDPDYALAHHVLGRWDYEVASLGPTKQFLVRVLYGGLPPASTAEAVRHLRRAVELEPRSPGHRVELGFALLADGQPTAARETFTEALNLPPEDKYDRSAQARARVALRDLHRP